MEYDNDDGCGWVWMLSDGNDGNDDADDNGTDAAYALVRWDRGGCDAR